jgi:ribosomal 50S subunit-recycling heat shock protein
MRVDKYLKLARLVKRRTVAQQMINMGAVRINEVKCKPSGELRAGDILEVAYTARVLSVEVLIEDEKEIKKRGSVPYRVIQEKRVDPDVKPW